MPQSDMDFTGAPVGVGAERVADPPALGEVAMGDNSVQAGCGVESSMAAQKTPKVEKGKAAVGGPSGLALTVTPGASIGFAVAAAPPPLRRNGKSKVLPASMIDDKPVVIDMEAALRAVAGKLAVGRVLSLYPIDPKAVVNELRGPWQLREDAVPQRVTRDDGRFVITFTEEGDRHHVLHAGP